MSERSTQDGPSGALGALTVAAGAAMVVVDVAVIYLFLATGGVPPLASYGLTALVAAIVGGSYLAVVVERRGRGSPLAPGGDPAAAERIARVVVSITVLSGVTVVLGYGGGLVLWASATLGGPDPVTEDGDLLRDRLLDWPERNRAFMRTNGDGELPFSP